MTIFILVILSNSLERVHAFLVDVLDTYLQLLPDDLLLPLFLIKVSLYGSFLRIPKGDKSVQSRTKVSIRVVATKFKWIYSESSLTYLKSIFISKTTEELNC